MSGPRGVTLTEMIEQARKFADANVAQFASYPLPDVSYWLPDEEEHSSGGSSGLVRPS